MRLALQDPFLRNLESRFALQQKIVEAAKKLANEPELCKTVKKKRRRNCLDAMHKLQQIENEMNHYRIKKGKRPTQRASVIIAGLEQVQRRNCHNLHDSAVFTRSILCVQMSSCGQNVAPCRASPWRTVSLATRLCKVSRSKAPCSDLDSALSYFCIQMTRTEPASGRGHSLCKTPLSSVHYVPSGRNTMQRSKHLKGKITRTKGEA